AVQAGPFPCSCRSHDAGRVPPRPLGPRSGARVLPHAAEPRQSGLAAVLAATLATAALTPDSKLHMEPGYVKYSIVIPAYNEGARLPSTLEQVSAWSTSLPEFSGNTEIIVVNDGSRDDTAAVVQGYSERDPAIRLVENPGNRGKGYSVRNGMLNATGEF